MSLWKPLSTSPLPKLGAPVLILYANCLTPFDLNIEVGVLERMGEETGHEFAFMVNCTYCYLLSEVIAWCPIPLVSQELIDNYKRGKSSGK